MEQLKIARENIALLINTTPISMYSLAERAGVSATTLLKFLRNGKIKISTLEKIANALGFSFSDLMIQKWDFAKCVEVYEKNKGGKI